MIIIVYLCTFYCQVQLVYSSSKWVYYTIVSLNYCRVFTSVHYSLLLQAYSTAVITVEVRLHSYSNPQSRECDGDDCDIIGECDNIFEFCLRSAGSGVCLTNTITTNEISEDILSFSVSQLSDLGITNPLRFSGITTSVSIYSTLVLLHIH